MTHLIIPFFSVIIGYIIALFFTPKDKRTLKLILAFSGSFLLSLTVLHLLPELYESHHHEHEGGHNHHVGLFIMGGILFQIVLEFFSKGAEHGHVHGHTKEEKSKMPWALFFSLCLHALLEGAPVHQHHDLAWGISVHHLPIAIILTTFLDHAALDKKKILFFMVAFATMTPIGTLLSANTPLLEQYHIEVTALVVGILFHISSTIIFESNEDHKFNIRKLTVILLGTLVAYFI